MQFIGKHRHSSFSILIIFVLLMIVGVSLFQLLNVQLTPSRSLPSLSVSYRWADASARVIEQEVTSKLEGLFSGVKGIKSVSSISSKEQGRIIISFKKTGNLDVARFEVASLIRQAYSSLHEQVSFPELSMSAISENSSPILTYTLNVSASSFYPLYLLAKQCNETTQHDKAIAMAKKVLAKELKIESTAIEEIKEEMQNIIKKQDNTQNTTTHKGKGRKLNQQVAYASCPAPFKKESEVW